MQRYLVELTLDWHTADFTRFKQWARTLEVADLCTETRGGHCILAMPITATDPVNALLSACTIIYPIPQRSQAYLDANVELIEQETFDDHHDAQASRQGNRPHPTICPELG